MTKYEMTFQVWPGMREKTQILTKNGIEFEQVYVGSHVPCQTHSLVTVRPKTEIEFWAARGIMK